MNQNSINNDWPFTSPKNEAALCRLSIIKNRAPILLAIRYLHDDSWFFSDGEPLELTDVGVVALESCLVCDPSIAEIANLQPGYQASRSSPRAAWQIEESPPDLDE